MEVKVLIPCFAKYTATINLPDNVKNVGKYIYDHYSPADMEIDAGSLEFDADIEEDWIKGLSYERPSNSPVSLSVLQEWINKNTVMEMSYELENGICAPYYTVHLFWTDPNKAKREEELFCDNDTADEFMEVLKDYRDDILQYSNGNEDLVPFADLVTPIIDEWEKQKNN